MNDRRYPIYILIDVSSSMAGEPIQAVSKSIQQLVDEIKQDPRALDTFWLSVITFGDEAFQVVPLTPLAKFEMPVLQLGGDSAFGPALSLLAECRQRECIASTAEKKGDWRPFVFAFVNGGCLVGNLEQGVTELKRQRWSRFVCIASGPDANICILKHIRPSFIRHLQERHDLTLVKFFRWVTGDSLCWPPRFQQMDDGESSLDSTALDGFPLPPSDIGIL